MFLKIWKMILKKLMTKLEQILSDIGFTTNGIIDEVQALRYYYKKYQFIIGKNTTMRPYYSLSENESKASNSSFFTMCFSSLNEDEMLNKLKNKFNLELRKTKINKIKKEIL